MRPDINLDKFPERRQESDLINNRITWLLVTQTVLLSAMSIGGGLSTSTPEPSQLQLAVRFIVPFLGVWVSICVFVGIIGAYNAMTKIENSKTRSQLMKAKQDFPRKCGKFTSKGITLGILAAWLYIIWFTFLSAKRCPSVVPMAANPFWI